MCASAAACVSVSYILANVSLTTKANPATFDSNNNTAASRLGSFLARLRFPLHFYTNSTGLQSSVCVYPCAQSHFSRH